MSVNGEVLFQIDNLCKAFGENLVLDHISTEIHKGEVVVIVGPSGSGKSTILKIITGVLSPTAGDVTVNGEDSFDVYAVVAGVSIGGAGAGVHR